MTAAWRGPVAGLAAMIGVIETVRLPAAMRDRLAGGSVSALTLGCFDVGVVAP